jgi:hypothetical protein
VSDSLVFVRDRQSALGTARQIFDRGRYQARLYKQYGSLGLSRRSARRVLQDFALAVIKIPTRTRTHYGRHLSVAQFALWAGRIYGSAIERVAYF